MASCCGPGGGVGSQPPGIPLRPSQQSSSLSSYGGLSGYGGMSSYGGYGGYGSGMYSPMGGMYGSGLYGNSMYGGGYGLNRFNQENPNSFVRMAEENSRQAFQSIESIVQAFGSVAMMLESTFHAVYNSFRAVIGVADHFSRMKSHFAQIFSALAVIRTLKWLYRKLLVLLRLREAGVSEEVWASAAEATLGATPTPDGKLRSSWPIMMFFAVVVGGPWLIWRLLSSLSQASDGSRWANGDDEHFVGEALYDFNSAQQGELGFRRGQRITLAPKELQPRVRGWLLASVDGKTTGLIPANYIKILGKKEGRNNQVPSVQPGESPRPDSTSLTSGGSCCKSPANSCSAGTQPHGSQVPGGPAQTDSLQRLSFTEDVEATFPDNVGEAQPDLGLNTRSAVPVTEQNAVDILEESTRQDT